MKTPRFKKIIPPVLLTLILLVLLAGALETHLLGKLRMKAYLNKIRQRKMNVIVITIDTLRQDRLSCYGHARIRTPKLDAFFKSGVGFTDANTCVPITLPSHVSILTGLYPTYHGIRDNGIYVYKGGGLTLAETLKSHGYSTGAFVSSYVLDRRFGLDKGFDVYDDDFSHSILKDVSWNLPSKIYPGVYHGYERRADEVTKAALEWLGKNKDQKFLLWVHYYDPHAPYYKYTEDFSKIVAKEPSSDEHNMSVKQEVEQARSFYDGEVVFTDMWVGKFLDTIQRWGLNKSTLIVVVADHGESLGEHEYYFEHGGRLFDTLLKVPLMLQLPYDGPRGVVVDNLVRTIDITPTIYHLLHVEPKIHLHGASLVPLIFGVNDPAPREAYSETLLPPRIGEPELRSIKTSRYKLIYAPALHSYGLYDLRADPGELANLLELSKTDPALYEKKYRPILLKMKEELDHVINSTASGIPSIPENLDEETKKALKSLGYM